MATRGMPDTPRGGPHGQQKQKKIRANTKLGRPRPGVVWPRPFRRNK